MRKIYKYVIENKVMMHRDAIIVSVQLQHGVYTIWAVVDPDAPLEERRFAIIGTGWTIENHHKKHLATLQDSLGFVWHVFECE